MEDYCVEKRNTGEIDTSAKLDLLNYIIVKLACMYTVTCLRAIN